MAVPSYTTDLAVHNAATSATGFAEATGFTNTNGSGAVDSDLAIYGTVCISEAQRKSGKGSLIYTGTARTLATNEGFFIWFKWFAPNAMVTKASGGMQLFIGSNSSNFRQYYIDGSDTYGYGGWKNYFADPRITPSATTGSPGTTYASCGIGVDITYGISKGNSFTLDIIRYGRGELIITGGEAADYAIFSGIAAQNDNTSNRWGLFADVGGSYLWKGLMSLGTSGTPVDFRDSNVVISIDDTEWAQAAFNRIEVTNASSNVEWNSILISSLGTVSRGEFEMIDNATVTKTLCTFTDMSTFIYQSNATLTSTTFRRCGQVTQGGATLTGCLFDKSTATTALNVANASSSVTNCDFVSSGTGHALEGFTTAGTYTLSGMTFTGYAGTNGSTGNEAIYVTATTGTVNLQMTNGSDATPSIRTAGATVNVQTPVTITFTNIPSGTNARLYLGSANSSISATEEATEDNITDGTFVVNTNNGGSNAYAVFTPPAGSGYLYRLQELTPLPSTNSTIPVFFATDRVYST